MPKPSLEGFAPEQIEELADTTRELLANPATRAITLRAMKKINPALSTPEIDLEDRAVAEFKKRDEKIAELTQKELERDARERIRDEREKLLASGHSREDIAAIEKLMMDRKIPDYATAAEFFTQSRKLAEPTPAPFNAGRPPTIGLPEDPLKAAKAGPKGLRDFARNQASAALDEIRSGKIKLH